MRLPSAPREARLTRRGALAPVPGFERLVSVSVGPDGEAVALWSDAAGAAALASSDDSEDDLDLGPLEGPAASVVVTVQDGFETRAVRVAEFVGASPLAQPLPDGRVIICGTWAEWRPGRPDLNATIYGRDGTPELS